MNLSIFPKTDAKRIEQQCLQVKINKERFGFTAKVELTDLLGYSNNMPVLLLETKESEVNILLYTKHSDIEFLMPASYHEDDSYDHLIGYLLQFLSFAGYETQESDRINLKHAIHHFDH